MGGLRRATQGVRRRGGHAAFGLWNDETTCDTPKFACCGVWAASLLETTIMMLELLAPVME